MLVLTLIGFPSKIIFCSPGHLWWHCGGLIQVERLTAKRWEDNTIFQTFFLLQNSKPTRLKIVSLNLFLNHLFQPYSFVWGCFGCICPQVEDLRARGWGRCNHDQGQPWLGATPPTYRTVAQGAKTSYQPTQLAKTSF